MKISTIYIIFLMTTAVCLDGCTQKKPISKQVKTELYLGLSNASGDIPVSQWNEFRKEVVENTLSGFTELTGEGYWQSESGEKYFEKSVILIYIHDKTPTESQKIDSLITLFKTRFNQESVLQTDYEIDVAFK